MARRVSWRRCGAALAALAAVAPAGCGGGVWWGVGGDDEPPTVALAADVEVARPGQVVGLVAAAGDDFAVDHVAFYRVDPSTGGATLLARDGSEPYRVDVTVSSAAGVERFFARAVDDAGQVTESATVSVAVVP